MLILIFGLIDLSRAIFVAQVITNLAGQGSSMASRGTTLARHRRRRRGLLRALKPEQQRAGDRVGGLQQQ